ncbi:MAG: hypothetical protein WCH11_01805 [Bdellovibrio sp.]
MSSNKSLKASKVLVEALLGDLASQSSDPSQSPFRSKDEIAAEPTAILTGSPKSTASSTDFANPQPPETRGAEATFLAGRKEVSQVLEPRTAIGQARPSAWQSPSEAQIQQIENLRLAQKKILELERELERLREENDSLLSTTEFARAQSEEMKSQLLQMERARSEQAQTYLAELNVLRENLRESERLRAKLKNRVEEIQSRLHSDMKKIRVRERELENRLELAKIEKSALLKSKDESLLELKTQVDSLKIELQQVQQRNRDLKIEGQTQQEQLSRSVRALKLALSNLEGMEKTDLTLAPFRKAE